MSKFENLHSNPLGILLYGKILITADKPLVIAPLCKKQESTLMESKRIRVLVVDDESDVCNILKTALEGPGVDIETAVDGDTAMHILSHSSIDVLIMDIHLPDVNGFGLLGMIRQQPKVPEILLMTGYLDQERANAIRLGASGIIQKPFSTRDFVSWLHFSLNERLKPYFEHKLRFPVQIPVQYGSSMDDLKHEGTVLNISSRGLLIATSRWAPKDGETVYCSLNIPSATPISLVTVTRWTRDLHVPKYKQEFGAEIQLHSGTGHERFEKYLRSLFPSTPQHQAARPEHSSG